MGLRRKLRELLGLDLIARGERRGLRRCPVRHRLQHAGARAPERAPARAAAGDRVRLVEGLVETQVEAPVPPKLEKRGVVHAHSFGEWSPQPLASRADIIQRSDTFDLSTNLANP